MERTESLEVVQGPREATGVETTRGGADLTIPVGDLATAPPLFVDPDASVAEAAKLMHEADVSSVLVTDEPRGILTNSDLRSRVLAEGLSPETPVRVVMSRPLKMFPAERPVYRALLFMLEEGIEHLPVTRAGHIVGMVTDVDLLRHQAKSPLLVMKRIEGLERPDAVSGYSLEVAGTAEALLVAGLDPAQIARVIASLNDALTSTLLRLAEEELGPPPCPYAWMVLGSEGRMEQVLLSDQDNALVFFEDSAEAETYFGALAERVVTGLIEAGFPRCPGGYMATGWRRSLSAWRTLFRRWVESPQPRALLEAEIFFDFRPVHGELSLDPLDEILVSAGRRGVFLPHLARTALTFRPPTGLFGRIRAVDGWVDLKRGGIASIAGLARVYALEALARVQPTLERLEAAAQARTLSRNGAELLAESFRLLLRLRLREQLRALRAGEDPTNKVRLEALSSLELRHLREAFHAIHEMQEAMADRFQTGRLA